MNEKRVLIVDDDDEVADLIVEIVRGAGFKVSRANCGDAAVDMLEISHSGVGLVITDLSMPNGNGMKVKKFAESLGVKVLVLSAVAQAYAPVLSTSAFMAKPWNNEVLVRVVRTAMGVEHVPLTDEHLV